MKFKELALQYMNAGNPLWRVTKPSTKERYADARKDLAHLDDRDIKSIQRKDVIALRDCLYGYPGKCGVAISLLRSILQYAYDRGMIDYNHATNIRHMPSSEPIRRWTEEEYKTIMGLAHPNIQLAIAMGYYTGQRIGDVVRTRWKQYDGTTITLKQQKTGKRLVIPAHPKLKAMIDARTPGPPLVPILVNTYGQTLTAPALQTSISQLARKAGFQGISFHGLRKSATSNLLEAGCTVAEVAAITGQSYQVVEHYAKEINQKLMAENAIKKIEAK